METVSWEYFEAHEGKNLSDTLGSIVKCEMKRQMDHYPHGVRCAAEVVSLLHQGVSESTKKFKFICIEEFPFIDRIPSVNRDVFEIDAIISMHSIRTVDENALLAQNLTCTKCTPSAMCNKCNDMDIYVMENGTDDNSDTDSDEDADDSETDASDQESCESHDEYEEEFKDGDIVWGKYERTWYPARVCAVADLPNVLASRLKDSVDLIPLKWYGENNFSLVRT